jgi:transposase
VTAIFVKKSLATIKGKTYCNYKIVESYRSGGKVKHRILFPLGALSDDQAERMRLAVSAYSNPDIIVSKADDIVVTKHAAYLDVAALYHIWREWGFDDYFGEDYWVKAMVINRAAAPSSKFSLKEWMGKTALPAFLDIDPQKPDPYDVYRSLDRLCDQESELQSFIYAQIKKHYPEGQDAFFYDLTSTYFEGKRCALATFGYSRDHRPDCEQIVIALLITPEGYPFYWRVLPGNTQDVTTVQGMVKEVKERFGIEKCTMIFDRGMVSSDNLALLEEETWAYISCLDKDEIVSLSFFDAAIPGPVTPSDYEDAMRDIGFEPFDENRRLFLKEKTGQRRHILTFDVDRFLDERRQQERKLKQALTWIAEKNQELAQAKRARSSEALQKETKEMQKRKCVKKFLDVQIEPATCVAVGKNGQERQVKTFRLVYSLDQASLEQEQRLHGVTCFITTLANETIPAREVIIWYRRKNKVEEAFHEIKSHLELRPVWLTRANRVKAHVTACVLAYFLYNDIEQRLRKSGSKLSSEDALRILKECLINQIAFQGVNQRRLSITQVSPLQQEIIAALGAEEVIDPKLVKRVLKKVENYL